MKHWTVLATFPELPSAIAEQMVSVPAGNPGLAASRAMSRMRKESRIKGRRITEVTFTVRMQHPDHAYDENGMGYGTAHMKAGAR
jgi:hypothetical protein